MFWHIPLIILQLSVCTGHIVAVDSMKPTIFCITERGELLRWFDCANYMREPSDITMFGNEYYVCDFKVCMRPLLSVSQQGF